MMREIYRQNPCGASSLPFWKAKAITIPENMRIVHDRDFQEAWLSAYDDTPYFRLLHTLETVDAAHLLPGFRHAAVSDEQLAAHINTCYNASCVDASELQRWRERKTYNSALWVAVCDELTGDVAASGIAEMDPDIGEGVLEWIQVAPAYRGRQLGRYIVLELLHRMQGKVQFVTVSGQCNALTKPEALYRSCGFVGNDVWHILKHKK